MKNNIEEIPASRETISAYRWYAGKALAATDAKTMYQAQFAVAMGRGETEVDFIAVAAGKIAKAMMRQEALLSRRP